MLRRDKNAQAGAIGAMLAFMMLLLLISMVMLYYMPAWMKEKEFSHMRSVEEGFMDITSTISSYVLTNDKTTETKIPIQLGTEGIPLIVTGTLGTLAVTPYTSTVSIYNTTSSTNPLSITSMGCIKFTSQNRYYINQNFIYESGAMFVEQSENTTMRIEPDFNITNNKITLTFITIVGSNSTITGAGTQTVRLKMAFCETTTYTWSSENITINITSERSSAWKSFFERKFSTQNISSGSGWTAVAFQNIKELELRFVAVNASISAP